MKRSTEFISTLLIFAALLAVKAPLNLKVMGLSCVASAFILSRGLSKRYRGMTYDGRKSREFWILVFSHLVTVLSAVCGVNGLVAICALVLPQMAYNLSRSLTKSVTRNPPIIRI